MNIIYTASRKERVHVEQIIREQPILPHECVDISTVVVSKRMGLSMDIYQQSVGFKGPRPIIIDVHGGGLSQVVRNRTRTFVSCLRSTAI